MMVERNNILICNSFFSISDRGAAGGESSSKSKQKFGQDNLQPHYSGGLPINFRTLSNTNIVLTSASVPKSRMIKPQRYFVSWTQILQFIIS